MRDLDATSNNGEEEEKPKKLLLPSLVLSSFTTQPPLIITGLLLIEIGLTFGHPVGVAGQIRTLSSVAGMVFALLMGVLSVRYDHKSLLLMGQGLLLVSAMGCNLSVNFNMMLLAYALTGVGSAMINPMSSALIGEHFPLEERSSAIGWMQAGTSIAFLVGSPAVSYIAKNGGWRTAFLGLMLPISLICMAVSYIGVPSTERGQTSRDKGSRYSDGIKEVLTHRSAIACLFGTILAAALWGGSLTYMMSYFRQNFLIATGWASILLSGLALSKTLGHLSSGYFINRFGRKPFTIISLLLLGLFTTAYLNLDLLWPSMVLVSLSCVFAGFMDSARTSLSLEQIPEYRGSMMSLNRAAYGLGGTLGTGLGGLVLISKGYEGLGISLGVFGLISAVVFHFLTVDPTTSG
jgi:predicted MFS family arabinose efflux permease